MSRPVIHLRPMSELTEEHGTVIIFHAQDVYGTCTRLILGKCEEKHPGFISDLIGWCELPELVMPPKAEEKGVKL